MTWEEAIKKIIQQYWNDDPANPTELAMDKIKKTKYNKKYFDGVASEYGHSSDTSAPKKSSINKIPKAL
jgi:hypothetical protein